MKSLEGFPRSGGPDVSVLMTAYNSEKYVADAIASILQQETTYTVELLFVDDGSSDSTLAIASELASQHPHCIHVLQHPGGENRGISASRNLALQHATGEFVAFLDSDDVWLPHHLQTQVTLLRQRPGIAMVYAAAERWTQFDEPFDEPKARLAKWGENFLPPLLPKNQRSGVLPKGRLLQWFQMDESLVPCICTVVVRTTAARQAGGFCDAFRGLYDDQAFHAKIILQNDVFANDVCTARYRQHPESCCGQHRRDQTKRDSEQLRFQQFLLAYSGTKPQGGQRPSRTGTVAASCLTP